MVSRFFKAIPLLIVSSVLSVPSLWAVGGKSGVNSYLVEEGQATGVVRVKSAMTSPVYYRVSLGSGSYIFAFDVDTPAAGTAQVLPHSGGRVLITAKHVIFPKLGESAMGSSSSNRQRSIVGETDLKGRGSKISVEYAGGTIGVRGLWAHPGLDIALLLLDQAIDADDLPSLPFWKLSERGTPQLGHFYGFGLSPQHPSQYYPTLTGWAGNASSFSDDLKRKGKVYFSRCDSSNCGDTPKLTSDTVDLHCATGLINEAFVCPGDSGGPLIDSSNRLRGIVNARSAPIKIRSVDVHRSIYTDVQNVLEWLVHGYWHFGLDVEALIQLPHSFDPWAYEKINRNRLTSSHLPVLGVDSGVSRELQLKIHYATRGRQLEWSWNELPGTFDHGFYSRFVPVGEERPGFSGLQRKEVLEDYFLRHFGEIPSSFRESVSAPYDRETLWANVRRTFSSIREWAWYKRVFGQSIRDRDLEKLVRNLKISHMGWVAFAYQLPEDWTWEGYLAINSSLANMFGRPGNEERTQEDILIEHYINWGRSGGLNYRDEVDTSRPEGIPSDWTWEGYLAMNPTLANMFGRPGNEERTQEDILIEHYINWGRSGGLNYRDEVDTSRPEGIPSDWTWEGYLAMNPTLANMFGRPGNEDRTKEDILIEHYLKWGQMAGKLYKPWTAAGYLRKNPGLSNLFSRSCNAGRTQEEILWEHFRDWGAKAGKHY